MRIVYNSVNGRYSDSPAAVHKALLRRGDDHEHVWLSDPQRHGDLPAGVPARDIRTPAAVEALEAADLVVSDTHVPLDWTKRPGATYVQTWHGTPLKRVHGDILRQPQDVLERNTLDVLRWDVLLSPSPYGTGTLRSAFSWLGPVLEIGLPRNDVLQGPDAGRIRDDVRRELGIADGQTAVLYTPTFRDDTLWEHGAEAQVRIALDAASVQALGPEYVVLVRQHYLLQGRPLLPDLPSVRDVSRHPDVAELYLAADVMVTDYSSTMFDFAVTGKPLVLYTYDLEHYRDDMRGFYFDLSEQPPGPLVRTQEELVDTLRDLAGVQEKYADAYERFRRTFNPLDDGRATERFLEHLITA